jgi:gamma-glutamyl hercynylcysteine S-oxide synthase
MKSARLILVFFGLAALAGCPLELRSYVELLQIRDTLGPITEIAISTKGDSFGMGVPITDTTQTFTYSFLMSKYEITNAQYRKFMDDGGYTNQSHWTTNGWAYIQNPGFTPFTQPANWTDSTLNGSDQPVTGVSWYEAVAYCNWRSTREGLTPAYAANGAASLSASGYRLPTEAEWEYAAAKGAPGQTERLWPWGDAANASRAVCGPAARTESVGSKSSGGDTPQGLADMAGNAAEWCSDTSQPPINATDRYVFTNDLTSTNMVVRGGSWQDIFDPGTRCADSMVYACGTRLTGGTMYATIGFRTVRRI